MAQAAAAVAGASLLKTKLKLRHGESNPGHLRDRQRCYQLHHDGRLASSEDRTRDLALTKRMLCQLSYRGLFRLGRLDVRRSPPPPGPSSAAPPWQCVHSTRVVFNPSKVKIRVRVPMNARLHSLGAGPLLVAQVAWVRIPVKAFSFFFFFSKEKNKKRQFSTRDSRMVPHCSTDRAQGCLSSQFGWDALCSP